MTLNPDVVRARCAEIEESVQRLETLALVPLDDFLADRDAQDIASYRLLVAIEAALALCYHVSSRRLRTTPADYAGCFGLLGEAGIVAPDLTERLQGMAKFRNPAGARLLAGRLPAGACRDAGQPRRPAGVRGGGRRAAVSGGTGGGNHLLGPPTVEPSRPASKRRRRGVPRAARSSRSACTAGPLGGDVDVRRCRPWYPELVLDTHAIARSLTDADLTPDHVTSEQFKTGLAELRADIIGALAAQERRAAGYGIAIAGIAIAILRWLE